MEKILNKVAIILALFGFKPMEQYEENRMFFMRFKNVKSSAIARNSVLAIARTFGEGFSFSVRYNGLKGMIEKAGEYTCFIPNISGEVWQTRWVLDVYNGDDCVGSFVFFIK